MFKATQAKKNVIKFRQSHLNITTEFRKQILNKIKAQSLEGQTFLRLDGENLLSEYDIEFFKNLGYDIAITEASRIRSIILPRVMFISWLRNI